MTFHSIGLTARVNCTGRLLFEPQQGAIATWTEGHPFDAVPLLRLLQQTIVEFDTLSEGVLYLRFSNEDRLTIMPEGGFASFTIHRVGKPIIVGR